MKNQLNNSKSGNVGLTVAGILIVLLIVGNIGFFVLNSTSRKPAPVRAKSLSQQVVNQPAKQETISTSQDLIEAGTHKATPFGVLWPNDGFFVESKPIFNQPGTRPEEIPGWDEYAEAYFEELAERRDAAIAFAREHELEFTFLGVGHVQKNSLIVPERLKTLGPASNDAAFEFLSKLEPSLVLIEGTGSTSDKLSIDQFVADQRVVQKGAADDSAVEERLKSKDIVVRLLRDLPQHTAFYGEEWPWKFAATIEHMAAKFRSDPKLRRHSMTKFLVMFVDNLRFLRSEVMLIRGVEEARKRGFDHVILMQGTHHGPHHEWLAKEYGVKLDMQYPGFDREL